MNETICLAAGEVRFLVLNLPECLWFGGGPDESGGLQLGWTTGLGVKAQGDVPLVMFL